MNVLTRAREVQAFSAKQLSPDASSGYTDVEQWKVVQLELAQALAELERMEGRTPEEEGELVLALLMGYCVAVRNGRNVSEALLRAERVLPLLTDEVLKCKLAVYCYLETPDEALLELAQNLMEKLRKQGKGEDIGHLENLLS